MSHSTFQRGLISSASLFLAAAIMVPTFGGAPPALADTTVGGAAIAESTSTPDPETEELLASIAAMGAASAEVDTTLSDLIEFCGIATPEPLTAAAADASCGCALADEDAGIGKLIKTYEDFVKDIAEPRIARSQAAIDKAAQGIADAGKVLNRIQNAGNALDGAQKAQLQKDVNDAQKDLESGQAFAKTARAAFEKARTDAQSGIAKLKEAIEAVKKCDFQKARELVNAAAKLRQAATDSSIAGLTPLTQAKAPIDKGLAKLNGVTKFLDEKGVP